MQLFVIISNVGMMINVDANVKNWLLKDILGIPVIVNVNIANHAMLGYKNCKCKKRLADKLVEECSKNIDEAKLGGIALFKSKN